MAMSCQTVLTTDAILENARIVQRSQVQRSFSLFHYRLTSTVLVVILSICTFLVMRNFPQAMLYIMQFALSLVGFCLGIVYMATTSVSRIHQLGKGKQPLTLTYTLHDSFLQVDAPHWHAEYRWPFFEKLLKSEKYWVLQFAHFSLSALPVATAQLTQEMRHFLESKLPVS